MAAIISARSGWVLALGLLLAGTLARPAAAEVANPCNGFGVTQVKLSPVLPPAFSQASQKNADCIAWQQFIYLNWAASTAMPGTPDAGVAAARFGDPAKRLPTVWQSYVQAATLFSPAKGAVKQARIPSGPMDLSVLSEASTLNLSSIGQASGSPGKPQWLTTQRRGLTYYTVSLNLDEAAFILKGMPGGPDLTSFKGQAACAGQPGQGGKGGFNLPMGGGQDTDCTGTAATYGLDVGAIELKAAWVALPADGSLNYRYLTASASLTDPYGNTTKATVGLVGLHIIRRLPGGPQFLWSTFEQVDNAPDDATRTLNLPDNPNRKANTAGYTYYDPGCTPQTDPAYQCKVNTAPSMPCPSPSTVSPSCSPYNAPMQVTRMVPVEDLANSVNAYAWSLMPAGSVFNYYRLIDVQWPSLPTPVPPQSLKPLSIGGITPPDAARIVSNTTMETYVQSTSSCMDCHRYAGIAQEKSLSFFRKDGQTLRTVTPFPVADHVGGATQAPAAGTTPAYASSYSFIFSADTQK